MKYTLEERLDIGRQIYYSELTRFQAAQKYGISEMCARDYMRLYRDANNLPAKGQGKKTPIDERIVSSPQYEEYASMSKEELILELVRARVNEARLKKGYEVKGDGAEKVFIPLGSKNTK